MTISNNHSTHTTKTIALINTKAPFAQPIGKESLDAAMIFSAYEQTIALFFIGDGVYQLTDKQHPSYIDSKDYLKTFAALSFYDIEQIYVCQESLSARGLNNALLLNNAVILDREQFSKKLHEFNVIYRF